MLYKYYIPALLWALIIFIIIAIPGNYIPSVHGFWELVSPDKIIHLGMFAPLSFLIAWADYKRQKSVKSAFLVSLIFGIVYAFSTEILQYYLIVGRNGNVYDAIADTIGVLIGLFIFHKTLK